MIMNSLPLISAIVIMLVSSRFAAEASSQQPAASSQQPAAKNSDDGLARSQAEVSPSVLRTPKDETLSRLRRMRKSNL
jgi:hypothetical protein